MGAKFSSGSGATVFYDDGPITAPSGEQGTQRNEFQAKIASVTSSTTIGAVFLYDTSQDSDGGAWRKKCKGLSWFDEASSATRSARSEFPAMALIVADNVSANNETVTVYDLDDPAMPAWMVFQAVGSLTWPVSAATAVNIDSLYALNGRLYVGSNYSLIEYNFVGDDIRLGEVNPYYLKSGRTIASRNETSSYQGGGDGYAMVNANVNDVSATVLEGAELDSMGLPIPTVAVATAGGLSVIHGGSGAVYDSSTTGAMEGVDFLDGGKLAVRRDNSGSSIVNVYDPNYWADSFGSAATFVETAHGSASSYIPNFIGSNPVTKHIGNNDLAIGTESGLNLYKYNEGNPAESAVAYVTSDYNSGYMVGDIRGAWLANNPSTSWDDRSVKGHDLDEVGAVLVSVAETDSELKRYHGFGSSDYLKLDNHADFDFASNDFSIYFWLKEAPNSATEAIMTRLYLNSGSLSGSVIWLAVTAAGHLRVEISDDAWVSYDYAQSANAVDDSQWHLISLTRRGSAMYLGVDGIEGSGVALANAGGSLSNSNATLQIGCRQGSLQPLTNGSLALFRISATAPTPQVIKEIYEAEKPLFAANAKCTLQTNSSVGDLAYDDSTGLLTASVTSASTGLPGATIFRNLEAVDTFTGTDFADWSSDSMQLVAAAGGVSAYQRPWGDGGVILDLPALDVRAELNEGESKLPDDGKLHFSGVTTDATQTVIANIPIKLNETYTVNTTVSGHRYQSQGNDTCFTDMREFFYRGAGNDIQNPPGNIYKLEDLGTSTMDVSYAANTTANTIEIKVTGVSGQRVVWKASVEVQRITDKQYER